MMTSSNGNIFCVTGPLCGEFTGHRWTPLTKDSDAELWCFFFIYALNKRLSKQWWGWWFEMPSRPLWRHCNGSYRFEILHASRGRCCRVSEWLTHWGRMTHIKKLTTIGSDNDLSHGRHQTIIWTNAGILLIGPLGTYFNEISIEIQTLSCKKIHFKMLYEKWRPFCLGLNVSSLTAFFSHALLPRCLSNFGAIINV